MSAAIQVHLIDDDEAVLESLGDYLESQGLLVERYARADDAVSKLGGDPAETCIVSDVRMPVMSGLDLQKLLAEQGSTVPLILMNCRSRPTCSSIRSAVSLPSHRFTVAEMMVATSFP